MKNTPLDQANVYTDLAALQKLKAPSLDRGQAIEGVAKQFESMMVNLMLKSMRQANEVFAEGNLFHDSGSEFYQDMLDNQMSLTMSQKRGMGLADMLVKQLSRREEGAVTPGLYQSINEYPRNGSVARSSADKALNPMSSAADLSDEEAELLRDVAFYAEQMGSGRKAAAVGGSAEVVDQVAATSASESSDFGSAVESSVALSASADFSSPEAFIRTLMPAAERVAEKMGVDPRLLLAQSALETGWGRHMIEDKGQPSFNLFGIKADERWSGDVAWTDTTEYRGGVALKERAGFRAYQDFEESFTDYLNFLKTNPRYSEALNVADDPERYTEELQKAGYATDPAYAEKINRIMQGGWFDAALGEGSSLTVPVGAKPAFTNSEAMNTVPLKSHDESAGTMESGDEYIAPADEYSDGGASGERS